MAFAFSQPMATCLLRLIRGFEGLVRHCLFSEVLPDMLDRMQLRAMGRSRQESSLFRYVQFLGQVPSGSANQHTYEKAFAIFPRLVAPEPRIGNPPGFSVPAFHLPCPGIFFEPFSDFLLGLHMTGAGHLLCPTGSFRGKGKRPHGEGNVPRKLPEPLRSRLSSLCPPFQPS